MNVGERVICAMCLRFYKKRRVNQLFCNEKCRRKAYRAYHKTRTCAVCGLSNSLDNPECQCTKQRWQLPKPLTMQDILYEKQNKKPVLKRITIHVREDDNDNKD